MVARSEGGTRTCPIKPANSFFLSLEKLELRREEIGREGSVAGAGGQGKGSINSTITPGFNIFRVRTPDSEGNQMHSSIVWALRIPKM